MTILNVETNLNVDMTHVLTHSYADMTQRMMKYYTRLNVDMTLDMMKKKKKKKKKKTRLNVAVTNDVMKYDTSF